MRAAVAFSQVAGQAPHGVVRLHGKVKGATVLAWAKKKQILETHTHTHTHAISRNCNYREGGFDLRANA